MKDVGDEFYLNPKVSSSVVSTLISPVREETVPRKQRRKVDVAVSQKSTKETVEKLNTRTVKERLGEGRAKRRRRNSPDIERKKIPPNKDVAVDREQELDARMRRIREQNEAILKRRQEIEMEEKRFRLT